MNERDQAEKCSMSICSSICDSFCESHRLKLCNLCCINFHYGCQLTMRNNSENIKAAFMISSNLIKKLKQDGISFTLNQLYSNYDNEIEEMNENYNNFYERFTKDTGSFISNSNLICGVYSMIKKMFDSQAYKIACDFNYKLEVSNQPFLDIQETSKRKKVDISSQSSSFKRRRERKEDEKNCMLIEDEMQQIFSDLKEECKDLEQSNEDKGDQNQTLNQSLLKIFEERFKDLENKLAEESNAKKELQAKFKEIEKNTELNNDVNEIVSLKINELEEVNRVKTESYQEQHERLYKEIVKVKDVFVSTENKWDEHDSMIKNILEKVSTICVDLTKLEEKIATEGKINLLIEKYQNNYCSYFF